MDHFEVNHLLIDLAIEYLAQYVDAVATPLRRKRSPSSVDFNGMLVRHIQDSNP